MAISLQCVIFDFDGVLVDSNQLKYDAFFEIFSDDPAATAIVKTVLGTIREKTRYVILETILAQLNTRKERMQQTVLAYADRYNQHVQQGIVSSGVIPEAHTLLTILSKKYPLHIVSTTPYHGLIETIAALSIGDFFVSIKGSPPSKKENIQHVISEQKVPPSEVLIIGDGNSDRQAAEACGCQFIGIANDFNLWDIGEDPLIVSDISCVLEKYISEKI